jgi:hypothetical protein
MNTNALAKLASCIIGLGDTTHTVGLLKTFLKIHPNIPTGNLQINNSYDKATQDAIAFVQRNKGLIPTGRMDPDTWMALGTESNPIQIRGLFCRRPNNSKFDGSRIPFKTLADQEGFKR